MALKERGCYLLVFRLDAPVRLQIGALGVWVLEPGLYLYVGSAMAGFHRRLSRYFKPIRKRRWHIDYLLEVAELMGVILLPSEHRVEAGVAHRLATSPYFIPAIPGFGATDSSAPSHLFRFVERKAVGAYHLPSGKCG